MNPRSKEEMEQVPKAIDELIKVYQLDHGTQNYDSMDSTYKLYKNAANRKQMHSKEDLKKIVI